MAHQISGGTTRTDGALKLALSELAWAMSREAGRMMLGQMRRIEEEVLDPAARWEMLRTAVEQFSAKRSESMSNEDLQSSL